MSPVKKRKGCPGSLMGRGGEGTRGQGNWERAGKRANCGWTGPGGMLRGSRPWGNRLLFAARSEEACGERACATHQCQNDRRIFGRVVTPSLGAQGKSEGKHQGKSEGKQSSFLRHDVLEFVNCGNGNRTDGPPGSFDNCTTPGGKFHLAVLSTQLKPCSLATA
jgi:hypothetical protein